jgi:ABC-type antimicrobial peptide transport system permease subunit
LPRVQRRGSGRGGALLVTVAAFITIVAAFAALGPARRSLRLLTVDALRVDG